MKYRMRELVLRKGRPDKGFNWGRDFITCVEVAIRTSTRLHYLCGSGHESFNATSLHMWRWI